MIMDIQIGDEAFYLGRHPGEGWVQANETNFDIANYGGYWVFPTVKDVYDYVCTLQEKPPIYKVLIGEILREGVDSPSVPGSVKTTKICVLEELHEKNHS